MELLLGLLLAIAIVANIVWKSALEPKLMWRWRFELLAKQKCPVCQQLLGLDVARSAHDREHRSISNVVPIHTSSDTMGPLPVLCDNCGSELLFLRHNHELRVTKNARARGTT